MSFFRGKTGHIRSDQAELVKADLEKTCGFDTHIINFVIKLLKHLYDYQNLINYTGTKLPLIIIFN